MKPVQYYIDKAMAHHGSKEYDRAMKGYNLALQVDPGNPVALGNRAELLYRIGDIAGAERDYKIALEKMPNCAEGWLNFGNLMWYKGDLNKAFAAMNKAVSLAPDQAVMYQGLGNVLRELQQDTYALACYEEAIKLDPKFRPAYGGRAWLKLRMGEWKQGWSDFEFRGEIEPEKVFRLPLKQWDGISLPENLVLCCEQGFGDAIMCARFVNELRVDHNVILLTWPHMAGLFSSLDVPIITNMKDLPADYEWVPLMSVAGLLGATPEYIPGKVPYLSVDQKRIDQWELSLHQGMNPDDFKIGIIWRPGHKKHHTYNRRDIPLDWFEKLARPGVRLFSLQHEDDEQRPWLVNLWGRDTGKKENFFLDTAACMMNMDLIISTDTSTAHLAGALGRRTFVPLPTGGCWRWLTDRTDSPWYPTMTLFRQTEIHKWDDVFERMARAI